MSTDRVGRKVDVPDVFTPGSAGPIVGDLADRFAETAVAIVGSLKNVVLIKSAFFSRSNGIVRGAPSAVWRDGVREPCRRRVDPALQDASFHPVRVR